MQLIDYTAEQKVKERVEYIFGCFQKAFPNIRYDERESIIGIGEEGKQLLCYFKLSDDGQKYIKFKRRNEPLLLLGDIQEIDDCIIATIQYFQENDLTLRPQRERKTVKPQEPIEIKILLDNAEEGKVFAELLNSVSDTYDRCDIEAVGSVRLTNAFTTVGIITIQDLRKWSYTELMHIPGFGTKSYLELTNILKALAGGVVPEGSAKNKLGFLNVKATNKMIRKWENKAETKAYLESINYDESQFAQNSLGRVLCLRKKALENREIRFSDDIVEIKAQYEAGKERFSAICSRFEKMLSDALQTVAEPERNFPMICAYLGLCCEPSTMQAVAEQYGLTRERVNQIQKKALTKSTYFFSLKKEDGVLRYIEKTNFLRELSAIGIEAFLVYLRIQKRNSLFKAFKKVMFYNVVCPEKLDELIDGAYETIANKAKQLKMVELQPKDNGKLNYQGFELMLDEQGEVMTDIELLMKLKDKRLEIANAQKVPAYMICHNKNLVTLATFQPINKEMYIALSGFTSNTWEKHGYIFVEVIREHKN